MPYQGRLSMKKWNLRNYDKNTAGELQRACGISSLAASVLAAKGYTSPDAVMDKLEVSELSDPFLIRDMETAADAINQAIDQGVRICVYGDYDCDGIMAVAILYSYLLESGAEVSYYIPERSEGYGLNKAAVDLLKENGTELIITVDNGISAIEEAEYIYSLGMRLIVTDHHRQGERLPRAEAVVDPHRHDDDSPFKHICGAAVALKLVAALDGGDYTTALAQFGDLAAIATVADIVSLTGENRFIVKYGLELINNTDRIALIALKEVCGLDDKQVDSHAIGFGIAPRINASGRFGSPKRALELFLSEDAEEAYDIAKELDALNNARKDAEKTIISDIFSALENDPAPLRERVICLFGKGWHHGVIGIVAAKLTERFGKPCFIASEEDGEIRGSARSFGSFSVFDALTAAADSLEKFGGHPGAGGYTVKSGREADFRRLINQYALENHKVMPCSTITADALLSAEHLTVNDVKGLDVLQPFGEDNEKPLFLIENAEIDDIFSLSGGIHSKIRIKLGGCLYDTLLFRKSPLELNVSAGICCDMIVSLSVNVYREKESVSIFVSDIRPHGIDQKNYFAALNVFEAFTRGEELPPRYYASMLSSRDEAVMIYKLIPEDGINTDTLFMRLNNTNINFCRFSVALEAMRQLGLVHVSPAESIVTRVKVSRKADLDSAPILVELREKTGKGRSI